MPAPAPAIDVESAERCARLVVDSFKLEFAAPHQVEDVGDPEVESTGKVLTFTRTAASLANFFGPPETTNTLHDIPLGRYRLTGSATLAGGSRQAIRFGPWEEIGKPVSPVADYVVSFPAKVSLPYGLGQGEVSVYDAGWSASDPVPTPITPVAPQPQPTTPTTANPTTTCTTYSEYVGSIPVPC